MSRTQDLTGRRFGSLVVTSRAITQSHHPAWHCHCDCGNDVVREGRRLLQGKTQSCGCLGDIGEKVVKHNLAGQRFGRLTVIQESQLRLPAGQNRTKVAWDCVCDCGECVTVAAEHLLSGHTQSCGCLFIDTTTATHTKHGRASRKRKRDRTLIAYTEMKTRCLNPNRKSYKDYGGRGITICDRWLDKEHGFENFLEDMGECPPKMTLERIDVNGPYIWWNCEWATKQQQAWNKRNSVKLTCSDVTMVLAQWVRELGVSSSYIEDRLAKGWDFCEIVESARRFVQTRISTVLQPSHNIQKRLKVIQKHWAEDLQEVA